MGDADDLLTRLRTAAAYHMDESLSSKIEEAAALVREQGELLGKAAEEIDRLRREGGSVIARIEKLEAFMNGVYDV